MKTEEFKTRRGEKGVEGEEEETVNHIRKGGKFLSLKVRKGKKKS